MVFKLSSPKKSKIKRNKITNKKIMVKLKPKWMMKTIIWTKSNNKKIKIKIKFDLLDKK